jgi:hypothetical protein
MQYEMKHGNMEMALGLWHMISPLFDSYTRMYTCTGHVCMCM